QWQSSSSAVSCASHQSMTPFSSARTLAGIGTLRRIWHASQVAHSAVRVTGAVAVTVMSGVLSGEPAPNRFSYTFTIHDAAGECKSGYKLISEKLMRPHP